MNKAVVQICALCWLFLLCSSIVLEISLNFYFLLVSVFNRGKLCSISFVICHPQYRLLNLTRIFSAGVLVVVLRLRET
jgi:hypothetical protein